MSGFTSLIGGRNQAGNSVRTGSIQCRPVMVELPKVSTSASGISPAALCERVDLLRLDATRCLDPRRQAELGQFLTPSSVARLLARLFAAPGPVFRFLDPGAGVGSLSAALVAELCSRPARPERIEVTTFELDPHLTEYLRETLALCEAACAAADVTFGSTIHGEDFVRDGVYMLIRDWAGYTAAGPKIEIDGAILNPPYKKINAGSNTRQQWDTSLETYLASRETLTQQYAQERQMRRIPVRLPNGTTLNLTPGGQNVLVEQIVHEFLPRFAHGGEPLYVGDTGDRFAHYDREGLAELGVVIESHGKIPDLIVFDRGHNWLLLIEAVISHGPVNPKRVQELQELFAGCKVGLVYVTAFFVARGHGEIPE